MVLQVAPSEFAQWRDTLSTAGENAARPVMLDVREPWELQTACVQEDGFDLLRIPMREVPQRLAELDPDQAIACLCHHGVRSMQVARFLASNGFGHVVNIEGGIDAWSAQVDSTIARY